MTPSLPRRSCPLLAAIFALSLLAGCDKATDEEDAAPSDRQVEAAPSPIPQGPDRQGRKMLSAYNAVSNYLKDQDPNLGEHLQKVAAKFVKDKDKWRERLQDQQRALQPKITQLRDQLAKAGGQSADTLRDWKQELASLEAQHATAEHKLSRLEEVTSETWKSFRDELIDEDKPADSPRPAAR